MFNIPLKIRTWLWLLSILLELLCIWFLTDHHALRGLSSIILVPCSAVRLIWYLHLFDLSCIRESLYGRLMLLSVSVLLIGMLCKLQHYPAAGFLLIVAFGSFGIFYLLKKINDHRETVWVRIVKILFVNNLLLLMMIKMQHAEGQMQLNVLGSILFLVLISLYCFNGQNEGISRHSR